MVVVVCTNKGCLMGRTSVSLSLDAETLAIWKQIPLKRRSALVKEFLRTSSREGTLEPSYSIFEPKRVLKNDNLKLAELLANIPELPE